MPKKRAATLSQIAAGLGEPPFNTQQMASLITAIHNYIADHPSSDWFFDVFFPLYVRDPSLADPAGFPNRFEGAVTVLEEIRQLETGVDDQNDWSNACIHVLLVGATSTPSQPDARCVLCRQRNKQCVPQEGKKGVGAGMPCMECKHAKRQCMVRPSKLYYGVAFESVAKTVVVQLLRTHKRHCHRPPYWLMIPRKLAQAPSAPSWSLGVTVRLGRGKAL
jgi:hypothetical protein